MKRIDRVANEVGKSQGFGSFKKSSPPSRTLNSYSNRKSELEAEIQSKISSVDGLRIAMSLYEDIESYETMTKSMSLVEKLNLPQSLISDMKLKSKALKDCNENGWTKLQIQRKLMEITWDTSAEFRQSRYNSEIIPNDMVIHMDAVASWSLHMDSNSKPEYVTVLDVGCGTGVVFDFLKKFKLQSNTSTEITRNWYGVDISSEMLKICSTRHPLANLEKTDFSQYSNSMKFSTIVFNECLHNFPNITETLNHAANLLSLTNGRIVVSHPKGLDNVVKQSSTNKWLAPSLLPIHEDLENIAVAIGMKIMLPPNKNCQHYLAVLSR